ncbi:hypothetical protein L6164_037888 [Bauhinia variegata]|nr:hypothetical protein L6164_037888 [Bauhinia variegata]
MMALPTMVGKRRLCLLLLYSSGLVGQRTLPKRACRGMHRTHGCHLMPSGTVVAPLGASICPFALLLVGVVRLVVLGPVDVTALHVMVVGAIAPQGLANNARSNDCRARVDIAGASRGVARAVRGGHVGLLLVDPASSHMLVSKIKPCMCKYELIQTVKLQWLIKSVISLFDGIYYSDNRSNSRANTCNKPRLLEGMHLLDKRSTRALPVASMIHDNSTVWGTMGTTKVNATLNLDHVIIMPNGCKETQLGI